METGKQRFKSSFLHRKYCAPFCHCSWRICFCVATANQSPVHSPTPRQAPVLLQLDYLGESLISDTPCMCPVLYIDLEIRGALQNLHTKPEQVATANWSEIDPIRPDKLSGMSLQNPSTPINRWKTDICYVYLKKRADTGTCHSCDGVFHLVLTGNAETARQRQRVGREKSNGFRKRRVLQNRKYSANL